MLAVYGIPGTPEEKPIASGLNTQSITGYSSFGHNSGQHQISRSNRPQRELLAHSGRHTFKAGVEYSIFPPKSSISIR